MVVKKLLRLHTRIEDGVAERHNDKINEIVDKINELISKGK